MKKIAIFTTIIIVVYLIMLNYSIWRANVADADALRVFSQNPELGLVLFEKSLSYKSPYKSEYQFDLIASVAGAVEKGVRIDDLENVINLALDEAEKAVSTHPKIASGYTDMAKISATVPAMASDWTFTNPLTSRRKENKKSRKEWS